MKQNDWLNINGSDEKRWILKCTSQTDSERVQEEENVQNKLIMYLLGAAQ